MNKKQKRSERHQRRIKNRALSPRLGSIFKITNTFFKKNWVAVFAIVIPVLAAFAIYYLSYVAEPDIRCMNITQGTTVDRSIPGPGKTLRYQQAIFRFKNFSFKSGFVDRVEFVPATLSKNVEVEVQEIEKVRIAWREEKDILVKWIVKSNEAGANEDLEEGRNVVTLHAKFFDNVGTQIPEEYGHLNFFRIESRPFTFDPP